MKKFINYITIIIIACSAFIMFGCKYYDTTTQKYKVDSFNSITNNTSANIHIRQSDVQSVEVSAPAKVLNNLELYVEDNTLTIENKRLIYFSFGDVDVYINIPKLYAYTLNGSGNMNTENIFDSCSTIKFQINGSGNINASIHSNSESGLYINGSGNIDIDGYTDKEKIIILGSGNINGYDFHSNTSDINISGSGNCEITVDSLLNATISGSGNIKYKGYPLLNTNISGSGNIKNKN